MNLLQDMIVVDFSQFLSGPSAGLRLADMGARVIKIERPGTGDICRQLYVSDTRIAGESTIFHAINRNKESYAADLKVAADLERVKTLIGSADVVLHNFRPGVMERLGLDYATVRAIKPDIIYGAVSGYGSEGPWAGLPGQDLLVQAMSGLTWLSNNRDERPTPMGVSVVDILAGTYLAQGLLAAIYRRAMTGAGALVEVSMLETILDFQFEVLTCFYNDGRQLPVRSQLSNGNAYIPAPYGIYKTREGYLALAMGDIVTLSALLQCPPLEKYSEPTEWFDRRDEIKSILTAHLLTRTADEWLSDLLPADVWCAKVMDYHDLMEQVGYQVLNMELKVRTSNGLSIRTTRCPIRVDGQISLPEKGAPVLGEHNRVIDAQFGLGAETA
ncbi:MAG TPA: CaiB/BaiF CoA-transferase family protein [Puia sp.]|nr:CaiB/BaiF CoA-transferase family protein [Puia sp.]